jgi:hypothetical protein
MPTTFNLFIVAGNDTSTSTPVVMTSPDAVTWTDVPSWPGGGASKVDIANGVAFVATGAAGTSDNYAWSTDGVTWTLDDMPPAMSTMAWTGTVYVAYDNSDVHTNTATDSTWNGPYSTGSTHTSRRMIYAGGVLAAGGIGGGSSSPIIYSSDEGLTWSGVTADTRGCQDLAYGAGRWVGVRRRTSGGDPSDIQIWTSTSGTSWSLANTGFAFDNSWLHVVYGAGKFVALGTDNSGNTSVIESSDGVTWSVPSFSGLMTTGLSQAARLAYGLGKFILVNPGSGNVWTSTDGNTWSAASFANRDWRGCDAGTAVPVGGIYVDGAVHLS